MKNLIALMLTALLASGALAQTKDGMHFKNGVWIAPTPQSALDAILSGEGDGMVANHAAAVLRQKFDRRSAAELDAFAEELGRIFVEGNYMQSVRAGSALTHATLESGEGIPYTKSRDLFIRIYESVRGTDVILASRALSKVFHTDGEDYVRDLFHKSPKPEKPCSPGGIVSLGELPEEPVCPIEHDPWCDAGEILASNAIRNKLVPPLPTDPPPEDIYPYCYGWEVEDGDVNIVVY